MRLLPAAATAVAASAAAAAVLLRFRRSHAGSSAELPRGSAVDVAIIVPGGGLTTEGKPTPWVEARLKEAAKKFNMFRSLGMNAVIVTSSCGTPHKPMPIDEKTGFQVFEAQAGAKFVLQNLDVPVAHIFEENLSLDTIGNAYMLRTLHTEFAQWKKLEVITSEFHSERTEAIYKKVFSLPPQPSWGPYELTFVSTPDDGLEPAALEARVLKEKKAKSDFEENTKDIRSMHDLHQFMFGQHMAYSSKRLLQERAPIDPNALKSY